MERRFVVGLGRHHTATTGGRGQPLPRPAREGKLNAVVRLLVGSVLALSLLACAPQSGLVLEEEMPDATGCDDAFCKSGLRVALVSPVFIPGAYSFVSSADGVETACDFVVGGLEDGCGPGGPCLLDDDCDATANLSFSPHSVVVQVGPGAPELVEVTLYRGGSPIAASSFAPGYQIYEPGGPGCEPVCEIASAQLDIP
ncbi:MAG: hypothetical protein ACRBN8_25115 [Nannocystales bacterium]